MNYIKIIQGPSTETSRKSTRKSMMCGQEKNGSSTVNKLHCYQIDGLNV